MTYSPFISSNLAIISLMLPLIKFSCILVISFANVQLTSPMFSNISFNVFNNLCGASYNIIVLKFHLTYLFLIFYSMAKIHKI